MIKLKTYWCSLDDVGVVVDEGEVKYLLQCVTIWSELFWNYAKKMK